YFGFLRQAQLLSLHVALPIFILIIYRRKIKPVSRRYNGKKLSSNYKGGVTLKQTALRGLKEGASVSWMLGKIVFPVTVIITILQYTPVLDWFIELVSPLMGLIGLPGEAAMPLVLGNALHLYGVSGAIVSLDFTIKEVLIMAMLLSCSHTLFSESSVASTTRVRWSLLSGSRIALARVAAWVSHAFWSGGAEPAQYGFISSGHAELSSWQAIVMHGVKTAFMAVLQLADVIFPLMLIMQFFRELGWIDIVSKVFSPFTRFLCMQKNTSFTLVTGLVSGLAFGAGVMIQAVKEDGVSKKDTILALIFLVTCHAVI